jgi:hypothetical protein
MNRLKHILVVMALLATVMPCVHAAAYDNHHHDEPLELCAIAAQPCACHSCEEHACTDHIEIQLDRTPDTTTMEQPSTPVLLYILPETKPALITSTPPVAGILSSLQTVQLLI